MSSKSPATSAQTAERKISGPESGCALLTLPEALCRLVITFLPYLDHRRLQRCCVTLNRVGNEPASWPPVVTIVTQQHLAPWLSILRGIQPRVLDITCPAEEAWCIPFKRFKGTALRSLRFRFQLQREAFVTIGGALRGQLEELWWDGPVSSAHVAILVENGLTHVRFGPEQEVYERALLAFAAAGRTRFDGVSPSSPPLLLKLGRLAAAGTDVRACLEKCTIGEGLRLRAMRPPDAVLAAVSKMTTLRALSLEFAESFHWNTLTRQTLALLPPSLTSLALDVSQLPSGVLPVEALDLPRLQSLYLRSDDYGLWKVDLEELVRRPFRASLTALRLRDVDLTRFDCGLLGQFASLTYLGILVSNAIIQRDTMADLSRLGVKPKPSERGLEPRPPLPLLRTLDLRFAPTMPGEAEHLAAFIGSTRKLLLRIESATDDERANLSAQLREPCPGVAVGATVLSMFSEHAAAGGQDYDAATMQRALAGRDPW